jgi:hypothetical protein
MGLELGCGALITPRVYARLTTLPSPPNRGKEGSRKLRVALGILLIVVIYP